MSRDIPDQMRFTFASLAVIMVTAITLEAIVKLLFYLHSVPKIVY